jgi:hypothetical protein
MSTVKPPRSGHLQVSGTNFKVPAKTGLSLIKTFETNGNHLGPINQQLLEYQVENSGYRDRSFYICISANLSNMVHNQSHIKTDVLYQSISV